MASSSSRLLVGAALGTAAADDDEVALPAAGFSCHQPELGLGQLKVGRPALRLLPR